MALDLAALPDDVDALRAIVAAQAAELAAKDSLIDTLRLQLARLRRMQFGRSSERLRAEIEQLELALEDLEAEAPGTGDAAPVGDDGEAAKPARGKPVRRPLPDHLPREVVEHAAPNACPACGGSMRPLGEDVTEILDWVPGRFTGSCATCGPSAPAANARRSRKPRRLAYQSAAAGPGQACSPTCWCPNMPTNCRSTAKPRSWPATAWN